MLNDVKLCGRLTADPELKQTPNGVSVTSFSLAVERDYLSGQDKVTDFINLVAWRNTAEFICRNFGKGKMMIVGGELQVRSYKTQNGENRYVTEVVVNKVWFAGDKPTAQQNPAPYSTEDVTYTEMMTNDDDLPF